jgi:hypothetical protein
VHPAANTAPALTSVQGASICNDLQAWWNVAYNEDMPRFNEVFSARVNPAFMT